MYSASDVASIELPSAIPYQSRVSSLTASLRHSVFSRRAMAALLIVISVGFSSIAHAIPSAQAQFSGAQITIPSSRLFSCYGVAVDGSGNVYIADTSNNRVLKETLSGGSYSESTVATSGLSNPDGVAVDGSGNVYIADTFNSRVLKETLSGGSYSESTVASSGLAYPYGVAVDGSGNVYIADTFNSRVLMETPSGNGYSESVVASSGLLNPEGVAVDGSGNIYIADSGHNQVLMETLSEGSYIQSTIANSGLNWPWGVAVDGSGNVYIDDTGNNRILKETLSDRSYTGSTIASTGLSSPDGMAVDGGGNIYIADNGNDRVVEESLSNVNFGPVNVGSTSGTVSLFFTFNRGGRINAPTVLTQGAASLDFSDATTGTCDTNGTGYLHSVSSTCSVDVTFTPIYAGTRYGAVVLETGPGFVVATAYIYGAGTGPQVNFLLPGVSPDLLLPGTQSEIGSGLSYPRGIAVDGNGDIFVADSADNALREFPSGCVTSGCMITLGSGFNDPRGISLDGAGNLFVADTGNGLVKEMVAAGGYATTKILGSGYTNPYSAAVDGSGNVFVVEYNYDSGVKEILAAGGYTTVVSVGSAVFARPWGVAVDGGENVFVADHDSNTVTEMLATGGYTALMPVGSGFNEPTGIAVDGSGNVYVADWSNNAVKEILAASGYTAVNSLGSGLNGPEAAAVDGSGNVFVADSWNNLAWKLDFADAPSLSFAATNVGSTSSDSPQTVMVENIGNAALTAVAPGLSVLSDFVLVAGSGAPPDCAASFSLGAGASCNLSIDFAPMQVGTLSEALVLTDNALNVAAATQSILLKGTGNQNEQPPPPQTTPTIVWAPPSAINYGADLTSILNATAQDPFGNTVGGTFSYSATPTGSGASIAVTTTTILGAGTYTLTATFTPTDGVDYTTVTASVSLTVIASFGTANVGVQSPTTISVTLTISAAATLGSPAVLTQGAPGQDFTDAGTGSCTTNGTNYAYNPGDTCTVNVNFTASAPGARNGAVVLRDTSSNMVAMTSITGTGVGPAMAFGPGVINTLAGNGTDGYSGDGRAATGAELNLPGGLALDGTGNLYIAEYGNDTVRKVTPQGVISTLAGTGTAGYNGDGPAASAQLNQPSGLAVDGGGNLYIVNYGDGSIRVVDATTQTISTWAPPGGFDHLTGVAVDGDGNLYFALAWQNLVYTFNSSNAYGVVGNGSQGYSGDGGPAGEAELNLPTGLAVDSAGNLYIADYGNKVVRMVTPAGIISTVAGNAASQSAPCSGDNGLAINADLQGPGGVAVDAAGNLSIADYFCSRIRKVAPSGIITTVAGDGNSAYGGDGGAATSASLNLPTSAITDSSGNLYIADSGNFRVRKVDVSDAPSLTFPDTHIGSASDAQSLVAGNVGNAPLQFSQIGASAQFALASGQGTCATGTPVTGGMSCLLSVEFVPTSAGTTTGSVSLTDNAVSSPQSVGITGTGVQTTPTITWATPAPITYGTALSATQLNATASVDGTFAYNPAAGTVLAAGSPTLSVTFTPTDAADYTSATGSVTLTVNKATPVVTWATPAAIAYGTALSATQLDATSGGVAGTFVYTPALGTVLSAGSNQTLSVTFTPTDTADYNSASGSTAITVNKATPAITWATPAAITYGTALSGTQLNATASVPGTFVYNPAAATILSAGSNQTLSVTFTPTDTADYNSASGSTAITVNKATPAITWATPAAITYGTALSATQLDATSGGVAGTFVYTPALGTVLSAGSNQALSVTFTPTDTTDYTTATGSVMLTVNGGIQTTPTITWATPAAIASGTALSSTQLNATASVEGTFVYSPAAGTVPPIGLDILSVTFTPADVVDYTTATATIVLTVGNFFNLDVSGSPSQTIDSGAAAVYSLTVTPEQMGTEPGVVTFSATGLPPGATATFSPAIIPAGSAATGVSLTIQTNTQQAGSAGHGGPAALGLILLPLLGMIRARKRQIAHWLAVLLFGGLSLSAIVGLTGCTAATSVGPQPTSYTVVVTATCGKLQHSSDLTLNVQ